MEKTMVRCADVLDVRDGTHDSPKYVTDGYPLITSKNIKDGEIDFENVNYIKEEDFNKINTRSKVDIGDILMPMIGTIGNPVVVNTNKPFAIKNVALFKFTNQSNFDSKFVYYVLKSPLVINQLDANKRGGTQAFVSLGNIRDLRIPNRSLQSQKKVVSVLDKAKELIDKRKAQIESCDELIKSQFIEMFGDPRSNPYNWEQSCIGECYDVKGGKRIPKGMGYSDAVTAHPYLRATDMKNTTIIDDDIRYISDEVYNKIKNYTVSGGDIYLTNVGVNLGMAGVIPDKYEGANLTENAVKLVPKQEKLTGMFIAYYINSPGIQEYVNERKMSVGVPKLAIFRIESMPLIIPPLELQNKFGDFVKHTNKLKEQMQQSLVQLEDNFNALMQRAFKGELF